jgi:Outer membrane protein beta-barrel domain
MLKHALVAFLTTGLTVATAAAQAPPETEEAPAPEALPACPPGEMPPAATPAPPPAPPPPPPAPRAETRRRHSMVFAPSEVSLTTGAGPANYFGSNQTMGTDVGAGWDVRATFGAHSIMAIEAAYNGATNTVDMGNNISNGFINSNGIDGDFRLQLPTRVQPYVFAGVGWNYMTLNDAVIAANQTTTDNQVTVPAGGGLSAYLGSHATLDLRGTYRFIGSNDLTTVGGSNNDTHQWLAQARLGYTF